jgi:hypothetical protein
LRRSRLAKADLDILIRNELLKQHQTRDRKAVGEPCLAALEQVRGPWCAVRGAVNRHSGPGTKDHWTEG